MSKHYRVIVEELTPDADGDLMGKTVLELMGAGDMLGRFAPGAVAETLGAERAAVTVVMPQDVPAPGTPGLDRPTVVPEPATESEPAKPRTRRTKAQKAADDAAQALGFRDAAHRAEADRQAAPDPREPDPAPPGAPGYMTPDGPVVEQQAAYAQNGATETDRMGEAAAAVAPAKPYNPFG